MQANGTPQRSQAHTVDLGILAKSFSRIGLQNSRTTLCRDPKQAVLQKKNFIALRVTTLLYVWRVGSACAMEVEYPKPWGGGGGLN